MERQELLKSREYWLVQIQNNLFNLIENYRKEKGLNKSELAHELGVTKGYISQILNGDFDHKISKLVDLALAFNKAPMVSYIDLDKYIKEDEIGYDCFNRHIRPIEYNTYVVTQPITHGGAKYDSSLYTFIPLEAKRKEFSFEK